MCAFAAVTGVALATVPAAQASGGYYVQNQQTGLCATISGGVSTANNVPALQYYCDSHGSRRWTLAPGVGGGVKIQNVYTGKCLTPAGGVSTDNNLPIVQFDCDNHNSRSWWLNYTGTPGLYKLQNVQTGKCLTVSGGVSTAPNVPLVQFTCDTHPSRAWFVVLGYRPTVGHPRVPATPPVSASGRPAAISASLPRRHATRDRAALQVLHDPGLAEPASPGSSQ